MKSTPGPWIYDIHEGSFYIYSHTKDGLNMVADGDPDDEGIARIRGTGRGASAEEQEANARLIGAAPKLYEACSLMRSQHEMLKGHCECLLCNAARQAEGTT